MSQFYVPGVPLFTPLAKTLLVVRVTPPAGLVAPWVGGEIRPPPQVRAFPAAPTAPGS